MTLKRADEYPVGTVVRLKFAKGNDYRTYVAEVRDDFGPRAWAGSWHGFTLDPKVKVNVIELLWRPVQPEQTHPATMAGRPAQASHRD
jgi:hypothetical protein